MQNKVELLGYYGSDRTHALSAWTSTSRELTSEKEDRIPKLLEYLAANQHFSPFEKSTLHFLVTCDTATHIHFIKHRIGVSINGESARYKEHTEDKYYIPADWPAHLQADLVRDTELAFAKYHAVVESLVKEGVDRKRAKESARFYLPYNSQVKLDVSFNFRSFMHFQGLRNKPDAQVEVRDVAQSMLELVRQTKDFEYSLKGFGY